MSYEWMKSGLEIGDARRPFPAADASARGDAAAHSYLNHLEEALDGTGLFSAGGEKAENGRRSARRDDAARLQRGGNQGAAWRARLARLFLAEGAAREGLSRAEGEADAEAHGEGGAHPSPATRPPPLTPLPPPTPHLPSLTAQACAEAVSRRATRPEGSTAPARQPTAHPDVDSGIGGLTVLREARVLMPDRRFVYVADDQAFPYGDWEEEALRARLVSLFGELLEASGRRSP